jgi:N-acetylglucosamine-6-phosphate deacetylase
VGAVLATPHITCELIADNIHVHPAAMKIAWECKKPHHLILISDAVRAAGMPDGEYQFDERTVVLYGGAVRLPDSTLAGSALTLNRALYNLMQATGETLEAVWQTSSLNPARAIGMSHLTGSIEVGKWADLVLVDEHINIQMTIVRGKPVYKRETRRLG